MASKIKVDQLETADGTGTIALQNQLSGMTTASLPTGSVLQVVQTSNDTSTTISTTGSWVAAGLELSITPSSTSNKILIQVCGSQYADVNDQTAAATVFRDSTNLGQSDYGLAPYYLNLGGTSGTDAQVPTNITYLDSPSSTSSVTYSVKAKTDKNTYRWNGLRNAKQVMILTEIKG